MPPADSYLTTPPGAPSRDRRHCRCHPRCDPAALPAQSVVDTSAFWLPTPNTYRSATGQPGPAYWQNRASYVIEATVSTVRDEVRSTARILYENHAPDSLDQNLFAPGSINEITAPPPLVFGATAFDMANRSFQRGITLARLEVGDRTVPPGLWDAMLRRDLPARGGAHARFPACSSKP